MTPWWVTVFTAFMTAVAALAGVILTLRSQRITQRELAELNQLHRREDTVWAHTQHIYAEFLTAADEVLTTYSRTQKAPDSERRDKARHQFDWKVFQISFVAKQEVAGITTDIAALVFEVITGTGAVSPEQARRFHDAKARFVDAVRDELGRPRLKRAGERGS